MRVLVTGATGFIGKRLVKKLREQNKQVKCLVRPTSDIESLKEYSAEIIYSNGLDLPSLQHAMEGVDVVYHLAAKANPSSVIPYRIYEAANVDVTRNVLAAAALYPQLKKVLIVSSIAATGPSRDGLPLTETSVPAPITNYGKSKLAVEKLALEYFKEKNVPVTIVRPPMVYGVGDKDWLGFFELISSGGLPIIGIPLPGDHKNLFDFCYVDNLVEGMILAAENIAAQGKIYFISDERPYKIEEIIQAVVTVYNRPYPKKFWPMWCAKTLAKVLDLAEKVIQLDLPFNSRMLNWMTKNYWVCDISRAKKELGYNPKISLEAGIRRTVETMKQAGKSKQ